MRTWMRDDEASMKTVLERLRLENVDLAYEVQLRLRARSLVHIRIEKQFKEVEGFIGFTGIKTCGVGRYSPNNATPAAVDPPVADPTVVAPAPSAPEEEEAVEDARSESSLDEEEQAEVDAVDAEFSGGRD